MKEPFKQLPMLPLYQVKQSGEKFASLHEAAAAIGNVTANVQHTIIRRPGDEPRSTIYRQRSIEVQTGTYTRPTLLNEIEAVMKSADPEITALFGTSSGKEHVESEVMANLALQTHRDHIEASWDPAAKHVMFFSSGYDTRLLAKTLKLLADEKGADWLGDVRFCCFQPEIDYAKAIFDYIGLPPSMWFPIDPQKDPVDYYADCLDFTTIGAQFSESERLWGGPLLIQRRLEEDGYLDASSGDTFQGLSALFSDETSKWNRLKWGDVGWFIGCYLFDNPGIMPGRPDVNFIFPFASLGWMQIVTRYYMPLRIDEFKLKMLERLDPRLCDLDFLPNYRFQIGPMRKRNGGHIDQQVISPATAEKMKDDYRRSRYAQNVGPTSLGYEAMRVMEYFDRRNNHYIKAAIYEHLSNQGVTVHSD